MLGCVTTARTPDGAGDHDDDAAPDDSAGVADEAIADKWTSTIVLGTGTSAVIRPIRPGDAADLAAFHLRQSPESRYRRFFSPKPELSDEEIEHFTNVDFVDRAAFVVEYRGEFVAWASYERWRNRNDAEVAFMVDEEHHGKGIATLLLEHLAAVARSNGIERFTAQALGDNRGMLSVFTKAGWPVQRRFDSGVIDIDFPLADTSEYLDSVERREQRADSRAMARLLLPTAIAVIGASDDEGSVGEALWRNVAGTASCNVYPVNPNRSTVGGRPAMASVTDIDEPVALAVIAVSAAALTAVIEDCVAKQVRGAVVITAADDPGDDVDIDIAGLVQYSRRHGLRLIGPSSMGIVSSLVGNELAATAAEGTITPGRVAISMQSGSLGASVLHTATDLGLGFSWFVSLGDKSDVSANDLLQFWQDDDATSVIALYTESLGNPGKFARIARRVSATKPIVAVRTGAALVGVGNEALYRQTGVIEVPTVTALLDTVRVFANEPPMRGDRVALIANARSPEVLGTATLAAAGLTVVRPDKLLSWRNRPVDYGPVIEDALADDDIDAVMVIHAPPMTAAIGGAAPTISEVAEGRTKPVVAVTLGHGDGAIASGDRSVASFAFPEQAAAALGRLRAHGRWLDDELAEEVSEPSSIDRRRAAEIIDQYIDQPLTPPEAIVDLLDSYGIDMPPTSRVAIDKAVDVAGAIGYPIAIKALRRHPGRSVEAGIALDLTSDADVEEAVTAMVAHLEDDAAEVFVQPMLPPGVDVRVHVRLDERLGPVITVGLGGVQADAIADESSRLVPISPAVAHSMVSATRAAALLDDAGIDAFSDIATRLAQLASDHPEIVEIDLNPVIIADGDARVADAFVRLDPGGRPTRAFRRLEDG